MWIGLGGLLGGAFGLGDREERAVGGGKGKGMG